MSSPLLVSHLEAGEMRPTKGRNISNFFFFSLSLLPLVFLPRIVSPQNEILKSTVSSSDKKSKGRTGWPQHVWALELKQ